MQRILKQKLSPINTTFILHSIDNILSVKNQNNEPVLYYTISNKELLSSFEIISIYTGENIDIINICTGENTDSDLSQYTFLDTVLLDNDTLVIHVFYRKI